MNSLSRVQVCKAISVYDTLNSYNALGKKEIYRQQKRTRTKVIKSDQARICIPPAYSLGEDGLAVQSRSMALYSTIA